MKLSGRLELTWTGKDEYRNIERRILVEDKKKSYGDFEATNMLIHGDNLMVLKALESEYAGQIKCIYIDPPYNIDAADVPYNDNIEHSEWLSLMRDRIILLWNLLTSDGLLAIQIDDGEFARLYLMLSEICDEKNLKVIVVKMSEATGVKMASVNKAGSIPKLKEYIILAKKDGIKNLKLEKIPKDGWDNEYKTYCDNISDEDLEKVKYILADECRSNEDIEFVDEVTKNIKYYNINEIAKKQIGKNATEEWCYANANRIVQFATLTGGARDLAISKKESYVNVPSAFGVVTSQKKMYLVKGDFNTETKLSRCKVLFADLYLSVNPGDIWTDIKTTGLDNEGGVDFKNSKKPEKLIKRILMLNTSENDIVLDAYLGSGTTAAVAHKMGRRWIGIELGNHIYTHAKPRIDMVIDGKESGGITKETNWHGGGGYHFYELSEPLFVKHPILGIYQINKNLNDILLRKAICNIEGYNYSENGIIHGFSSEKHFVHITKDFVNGEYINELLQHISSDELITVYAFKYQYDLRIPDNIEIIDIMKNVLPKCIDLKEKK